MNFKKTKQVLILLLKKFFSASLTLSLCMKKGTQTRKTKQKKK